MKDYKILSTKGIVLDTFTLEKYLKKLASDHILQNKSDLKTYPIPRVKENYEAIFETYKLLNEHVKLGIPIHPAGEWILDNYYVVEETVKGIIQNLNKNKYKKFLGISNGENKGFARIYVLANEIVAYTDGQIDGKLLKGLLSAYQEKKNLTMEEIWNIGVFIQIALIEKIRDVCEKIYVAQMQKYKVENIVERLVENKDRTESKYQRISEYRRDIREYVNIKYPFMEYMSYKLRALRKKVV
ncbi:MAG: hypothetical protein Q4G05_03100 [Clostridia bacterium]|nr:hypothetical protein [Clostridia bacterium]